MRNRTIGLFTAATLTFFCTVAFAEAENSMAPPAPAEFLLNVELLISGDEPWWSLPAGAT